MSGELYHALWRRANVYLREAKRLLEEGEYDVSLAMAEQAAQLAIKAVYVRLLGYMPRGHNLRRMLGYLAALLEREGRGRVAEELKKFVAENRWQLVLLEDAYTEGRYGLPGYTAEEARNGIETAERLMRILREVEEELGG